MTGDAEQQLIDLQLRFAAAIRNPESAIPAPEIPAPRMQVYRELFFNNIQSGLESVFPVAVEVLEPDVWGALVRGFWREHQSRTPEYPRMSAEFLAWLSDSESIGSELDDAQSAGPDLSGAERERPVGALEATPVWLFELLVWEHAELESMLSPDDLPVDPPVDPLVDPPVHPPVHPPVASELMAQVPVLTASLQVYAFEYPVHRISRQWQPEEPEAAFLACYRTPQDQVDFMELTPPSAALLDLIRTTPGKTAGEHVEALAEVMLLPANTIAEFAEAFLLDLVDRHIIIGGRNPPSEATL